MTKTLYPYKSYICFIRVFDKFIILSWSSLSILFCVSNPKFKPFSPICKIKHRCLAVVKVANLLFSTHLYPIPLLVPASAIANSLLFQIYESIVFVSSLALDFSYSYSKVRQNIIFIFLLWLYQKGIHTTITHNESYENWVQNNAHLFVRWALFGNAYLIVNYIQLFD